MDDARDLVGGTVLVRLESHEGLEFIGIPEEGPFFCHVTAVDEVGMWVENKNFVTVELTDSKGKDIPKSKRKEEKHTANILLPWRNVRTVVHFPDKDAENLSGKVLGHKKDEAVRIGFVT